MTKDRGERRGRTPGRPGGNQRQVRVARGREREKVTKKKNPWVKKIKSRLRKAAQRKKKGRCLAEKKACLRIHTMDHAKRLHSRGEKKSSTKGKEPPKVAEGESG